MSDKHEVVDTRSWLGQVVRIEIDRPLGSCHPRWGFIYPVNYGFVPGIPAPDGDDLDAYLLGVFEPVDAYTGKCIAVIHRLDDDDDKLIVVPLGKRYTDDQIVALTEFQERFFTSVVIR
jgi:inorganic pyrophosphatase